MPADLTWLVIVTFYAVGWISGKTSGKCPDALTQPDEVSYRSG